MKTMIILATALRTYILRLTLKIQALTRPDANVEGRENHLGKLKGRK